MALCPAPRRPGRLLKAFDPATLAFADFTGDKQYLTAEDLATNDRVAFFLVDYPNQSRSKIIGHAGLVEPASSQACVAIVTLPGYPARLDFF